MPDLYALSLMSTVLSLCAWMTLKSKWKITSFVQAVFYISLTTYVFMVIGRGLNLTSLMFVLFRDLLFLSGTSAIFLLLRKNTFISFFFLIGLFAAAPQIYQYLTKSNSPVAASDVSPDWELLLEMHPGEDILVLDDVLDRWNLRIERAFDPADPDLTDLDDYFAIDIPDKKSGHLEKIVRDLWRIPAVEWVEVNEKLVVEPMVSDIQRGRVVFPSVNDPFISEQWAYGVLDMNSYYLELSKNQVQPQKKARLFILDTGVDAEHEDLKDNYRSAGSTHDKDESGHGTHCAGIAASVTNNSIGTASLIPSSAFVELTGIKVLSGFGFGTQKMVIDGILKAVDSGADVISLSLGGKSNQMKEKAYNQAMKYARDHNAIVVVAAGNSSMDASRYSPANSKNVIAVAAVDQNLERTSFSNTLQNIQYGIAAPGKDIFSTYPGDQYKALSGTSMATPFVSGLVAMMKSIKPDADIEEIYEILTVTGHTPQDEADLTGNIVQPGEAIKLLIDRTANSGL